MKNTANEISDKLTAILEKKNLFAEWEKISDAIREATSLNEDFECDLDGLLDEHLTNASRQGIMLRFVSKGDKTYVQFDSENEDGTYDLISRFPIDGDMVHMDAIQKVKELAYLGSVIRPEKNWSVENID